MNYEQHTLHRFTDDRYPNVRVEWEENTPGRSETLYVYQYRNGRWDTRHPVFDPYPCTLYWAHQPLTLKRATLIAELFFDGRWYSDTGTPYGPQGRTDWRRVAS